MPGSGLPPRERSRERGVSEVISVVLMVAVTIILAAMVGTVLLNVVTDVNDNPLAGATTDFDASAARLRAACTRFACKSVASRTSSMYRPETMTVA
jgi:flagellin-like protein